MDLKKRCTEIIENQKQLGPQERLHQLFQAHWDYTMEESPENATFMGYGGQNHRWMDNSMEALERRKKEVSIPEKALQSINRESLDEADRLNYDIFQVTLEETREASRYPDELMPVNQLMGYHQDAARIITMMPGTRVEHFEDIISRLRGIPTLFDQTIALMEAGLRRNITPPKITLQSVPESVGNQIFDDPFQSPFLAAFGDMPAHIPANKREKLRTDAKTAYDDALPAFRKMYEYLKNTYLPGASEITGFGNLPDGESWYQSKVKHFTTTNMTPQEIHDIGLAEVDRIRGEMEKVLRETDFKGEMDDFFHFLRTDKRFYFEDAEDLLGHYRNITKQADPELVKLFGRLPRLPYGVIPVPAYVEKAQTAAYYQPGSHGDGRAGFFFANTYDLTSRPKWDMEALALHEAVPGHHLQIALAQEMEGVPEFRKHTHYTAYIEGWGLYAEYLGGEMGFYRDPYSKFGRYSNEIWRAARLVVDTGLHFLGWSREKGIEYLEQTSGRVHHDVVVEVDRYLVMPGQALAYKIGELRIRKIREEAMRRLHAAFDIRAFHDEILGHGALPLEILEKRMDQWIHAQSSKAA